MGGVAQFLKNSIAIKTLRRAINYLLFTAFSLRFRLITLSRRKLIIFDIDNTVADTWPTLVDNHQSSWNRLSSLKAFEGVVNLIRDFSISGEKIIFISARDNRFHFLTRKWLVKNVVKDFDLFLVPSPAYKIKLLRMVRNKEVFFYDDMSHSQEKGNVLFYKDEIAELSKLTNVKYFGHYELSVLQKGSTH